MAPLALGRQNSVVYTEIQGPVANPTSVTLKRYTVSTRTTTEIVTLPHTNIYTCSDLNRWTVGAFIHTHLSPRVPFS